MEGDAEVWNLKVFESQQTLILYISIAIITETLQFIPIIEVTYLYNLVKKSFKSEQYEKRYRGLKFKGIWKPSTFNLPYLDTYYN